MPGDISLISGKSHNHFNDMQRWNWNGHSYRWLRCSLTGGLDRNDPLATFLCKRLPIFFCRKSQWPVYFVLQVFPLYFFCFPFIPRIKIFGENHKHLNDSVFAMENLGPGHLNRSIIEPHDLRQRMERQTCLNIP